MWQNPKQLKLKLRILRRMVISVPDVRKIIDSLDGDDLCQYCQFRNDCYGGVSGGPNGPIYPPCADGLDEDCFDLESYLSDLEEDGEES